MLTALSTRVANVAVSDAHIEAGGKYLLAATVLYYLGVSMTSTVPADVAYAINAHMPQGYDRSLIAARLQQRYTKQTLNRLLRATELREQLRTETNKASKVRMWNELFRLNLIGVVSGAYLHSLTISLFAMKNTVRVIVFLLRQRRERKAAKNGSGPISKVKAWWMGGTQSLIMESLMEKLADQTNQQASPFTATALAEDDETAAAVLQGKGYDHITSRNGTEAFLFSGLAPSALNGATSSPLLADGGGINRELEEAAEAAAQFEHAMAEMDRAFSVKAALEVAIPQLVALATRVVTRALSRRPPHAFSVAGIVTREALRELFSEIELDLERRACVCEWLRASPSLRPTGASPQPVDPRAANCRQRGDLLGQSATEAGGAATDSREVSPLQASEVTGVGSGVAATSADAVLFSSSEEEDIVEFPSGSTAMLGRDGRPLRQTGRDVDTFDEIFRGAPLETEEERQAREEAGRRELLSRERSASAFTALTQSSSFGELCIMYASEVLHRALAEVGDISNIKSFDPATDTVKMLMVVTAMEAQRQKVADADYDIKPYVKLFCEETVRATCSQS